MPDHGAAEAALAGNLTGFSLGLVISVLLLVLTLRAVRLPGTPLANVGLALCALLWNAGGLVCNIQSPIAQHESASFAMAVQMTGAGLWPLPLLYVWQHMLHEEWQCRGGRILQALAMVHATVVSAGMWMAAAGLRVPLAAIKQMAAYDGLFLLAAAAAMLLWGARVSRAVLSSMSLIFAGLLVTTLSKIAYANPDRTEWARSILGVTAQQSLLLVVIGSFFLFARFRFADVMIRYTVRLLLASACAVLLILTMAAPPIHNLAIAGFPAAGRFLAALLLTTGLLVVFPPADRALGRFIEGLLFHAPDYREAARSMGESLRGLYLESEVTAAAVKEVCARLGVGAVRAVPLAAIAAQWPAEIHEGRVIEVGCRPEFNGIAGMEDVELLVPVRAGGQVASALAIAPGRARRSLVSHEVDYLRSVATQLGTRLDLLRLEQNMAERRTRETVLRQQVTDAELRALRAQINPHFLFNSLNTIADLIATDPPRAEVMTLRLARVFRHVLANSSRQMVPVQEEMAFLRSYLDIEEARFGSRLQVEIDVAPEVALSPIPSLILQPVVENALRHGLGPKPGPGRLRISATMEGDRVCLAVEDNGVGQQAWVSPEPGGAEQRGGGLGLRNIVRRLKALYQDGARLTVQAVIPEGTRVTLLLPRDEIAMPIAAAETA